MTAQGAVATSVRTPRFDRRTLITLVALACGVFAATYGSSVMPGVIGHLSQETGIGLTEIGRSNALFGAVYAVTAPTLGWVLRRVDRLVVLVWALPLLALTTAGMAFAHTVAVLYAVRAAQAAVASVTVPFSIVHAGSIAPPALRSRALSIAYTGLVTAYLLGAPAGEAVARLFGVATVFWIGTLLAVGSWAGLLLVHRARTGAPESTSLTGFTARSAIRPASAIVIGAVLLAAFSESAGTSGLSSYLTPFLQQRLDAGGVVLSVLLLGYGLGGLAGNAVSGLVADRLGPAPVIVVTHLVAAAAVFALGITINPWLALLLLAAWGFASWAINPPLQSLLLAHGGARVSVLVGINSSMIYAGSALGAALASGVVDGPGVAQVPVMAELAFLATAASGLVAWIAGRSNHPATGHHESD